MAKEDLSGPMRTILFTGMTGRTGKCFLELLEKKAGAFSGCRLIAAVRMTSDCARLEKSPLHFELVRGDLTDPTFAAAAVDGVDTVLHIAGIHYSLPFVEIAARAGVKRMICVHTTGIYSRYKAAGEEYRKIDAACEAAARENGMHLTMLRPTMIYGDTDDHNIAVFIRLVDRLPLIPLVAGGRFYLQPVHREDLAKAYFKVLCHPERTDDKNYILSGDRPVYLRDLLGMMASALGKKAKFLNCPYCVAIAGAWILYLFSLTKLDLREKVQRLAEDRAYPHTEAVLDFGYSPRSIEEGIYNEVAAYRKQKSI